MLLNVGVFYCAYYFKVDSSIVFYITAQYLNYFQVTRGPMILLLDPKYFYNVCRRSLGNFFLFHLVG